MRVLLLAIVCLVSLLGSAAAEDEGDTPRQSAKELTEAEREAALERARELNGRVVGLWKAGKYRDAESLAREALRMREQVLGPEHPDVAESLLNLGAQLVGRGEYDEAVPLYERALEIWESVRGPEHPDVASSLNNLATVHKALGAYEEAKALFERALRIRETALDPDHPLVAASLNNLGLTLYSLGAYEEARPLYERAVAIRERTLGPDHPGVALALGNLAMLFHTLGDYEEARPRYGRALEIYENALGPDHPAVATGLNNLAALLHSIGAYEEVRPLYERALRIQEKALGPDHPELTTSLGNLAVLLEKLGAYEGARPLHERALRINEKAFDPDHPDVARSLNNLAMILKKLGAYEDARPLFKRALEIYERALDPDHPSVATCLDNVAVLSSVLGAHEEARPLSERALRIREKTLGPDHPHVATSLNNLAQLLNSAGDYEEAKPLLERALRIREKATGPDHPDTAQALNNLAALLTTLGAYEEARPLYERALRIYEQTLGPDHPSVAFSLNSLAVLHAMLGAHEDARPLLERALSIRERALGPHHPEVAESLNNLAVLYESGGLYEQAWSLHSRCLDLIERHIRRSVAGLQASERLALGQSLRSFLANSLRVAPYVLRTGQDDVLRFKGLLARIAAAECRLARADGGDAMVRVDALRAAERRFAKIANSPPSFRNKSEMAKWRKAYARTAAEREKLAVALAKEFAPLRSGLDRLDLRLPVIQGALSKHAVLVDYLRSGDHYIAWIMPHEGDVKRVDLGEAEAIEDAAAAFAELAADAEEEDWHEAAGVVRHLVLESVEEHIGEDVTTLFICPDAALAVVPFGALPLADGTSLLGTRYTISNISMAQDLVPWDDVASGTGALLLGGVDYDQAAETRERGTPRYVAAPTPRRGRYSYLSGTKAEVMAIKPRWGEDVTTVLGPDATEATVRTASMGKRTIHLATHGFVRGNLMRGLHGGGKDERWLGADMERQLAGGHDPMNLAGLAMAGANARKGGGDDDGILTALEASHLHLDGVELVVLSACQTALGTAESGEGVIGLVRVFQMAGAKQVIGSFWRVDDDATSVLMVKFYELWRPTSGKGMGAAEALQRAQAFVRSHEKWQHPYFWAAWVVWGVD